MYLIGGNNMKVFIKRLLIFIGFLALSTISPAIAIVVLILLVMSNVF